MRDTGCTLRQDTQELHIPDRSIRPSWTRRVHTIFLILLKRGSCVLKSTWTPLSWYVTVYCQKTPGLCSSTPGPDLRSVSTYRRFADHHCNSTSACYRPSTRWTLFRTFYTLCRSAIRSPPFRSSCCAAWFQTPSPNKIKILIKKKLHMNHHSIFSYIIMQYFLRIIRFCDYLF